MAAAFLEPVLTAKPIASLPKGRTDLIGTTPSYSYPELWGGGSPVEHCSYCDPSSLMASSGSQSTKAGQSVNPMTGDFSTGVTLFDVTAIGNDLRLTLTYDTQRADNLQTSPFGYGWESTFSPSVSNSGGTATVNEENGAEITFNPPPAGSDGCPSGDYQDLQKYTVPGSANAYCAPNRVDAQYGYFPLTSSYKFTPRGGHQVMTFSAQYGTLQTIGNLQSFNNLAYNITPGTANCSNQGGYSYCDSETDAAGRAMVIGINSSSQAVSAFDPYGMEYNFSYNTNGELEFIDGNFGNGTGAWTYDYTNGSYIHAMTSVQNPDLDTRTIAYDANGLVSSITDPTGANTTNYGPYGYTDCISTDDCLNSQTTDVYNADGQYNQDAYSNGRLEGTVFGAGSNLQSWTYNYQDPGSSDQDAPTIETVISPDRELAYIYYDSQGNVVEFTDFNGNTTNYMYNDTGGNNLDELCWTAQPTVAISASASCTHAPANTSTYTYDSYGNRLTAVDPYGNTTRYGYYNNGLLCWTAPPTVTAAGSSCANSGSSPTGAPTGATVYEYDTQGDQTLQSVAYNTNNAQTTTSEYDPDGELLYVIPPDGQNAGGFGSNAYETAYTYQTYQKPRTVTAPGNLVTTNGYDAAGMLITRTDPGNAGVTTNGYDADGRLCWTYRAASSGSGTCAAPPTGSTSYTYSFDTSAVGSVTDPNNSNTNNKTVYTYGDPFYPTSATEVSDPMSTATSYTAYDSLGRACLSGPVIPASGCAWVQGDTYNLYSDEGQLLSSTDQNDNTTTYTYSDPRFPLKPTSVSTPQSETTNYTYNADGQTTCVEDPLGQYVATSYDADRRVQLTGPASGQNGTCTSAASGVGATEFSYDAAGQPSTRVDNYGAPSQTTATYSFDASGNLLSLSDDNGNTVAYKYNTDNQVTCVAYPVEPGPTCDGSPGATNTVVDRTYDSSGRLYSTTDWLGNTVGYTNYNPLGEVGTITYPASVGETLNFSYDAAGNVRTASYSGSIPVSGGGSDSWTYNADEQQATSSLLGYNSATSNTYNQYGQVTTATNPATATQGPDAYSYQQNGPILSDAPPVGNPTTFDYNTDSELQYTIPPTGQGSGGFGSNPYETAYTYNADGQRTSATGPGSSQSYGWSNLGELCWSAPTSATGSCSSPPTGATTYSYDGTGLRSSTTSTSGTQGFTWDTVTGGNIPLDIFDGTNAYIYGPLLFGGTAPIEQIPLQPDSKAEFMASTPSGVQAVFGQATSATSAIGPGDKYTYRAQTTSAVGSVVSATSNGQATLSVAPQAAGDALVLAVYVNNRDTSVQSVSGGGANWTLVTRVSDGTQNADDELWLGTVTTPGASTVNVTYKVNHCKGTCTNTDPTELSAQEFTNNTGPTTTWSIDRSGHVLTDTNSSTITYPTLTPTSTDELYVGYASSSNPPAAGSTPGFVYQPTSIPNQLVYDTSVSSAAQPTATVSPASPSLALGGLLKASGPVSPVTPVGTIASATATGLSSLSVSPANVGDAMVLSISLADSTNSVTAVSGGGADWSKITSTSDATQDKDLELWLGKVNSTGSAMIDVSYAQNVTSTGIDLSAQEYTQGTGATTTWTVDNSGVNNNDGTSLQINYPSLTPSTNAELYVGAAIAANTPTPGTTSGVAYQADANTNDQYIYDDLVNTTLAPSSTQSASGTSMTLGALLQAGVAPSQISALSALSSTAGTGTSTLSVDPVNVGDAEILSVSIGDSTNSVTSVSGGGAAWTKIASTTDNTQNRDSELWLGNVTTAGPATINVSYATSVTSTAVELSAQEFTNGTGASTVWSIDTTGNDGSDNATTSVPLPSLTPAGSPELYVGYAQVSTTESGGTTAGFTYLPTATSSLYTYDPNVTTTASPTASQASAGTSLSIASLIQATGTNPVVSAVVPNYGPPSGGTSVTITGRNFDNIGYVDFGTTRATNTVTSETSITATAPPGTPGTVDITVTSLKPTLLEQAGYSTYGTQTIQQGTDITPFGYQGAYTDPGGLVYLIGRYYDPATAQFLSVDPLVNVTGARYTYAGDNPLDGTDPTGLDCTNTDSCPKGTTYTDYGGSWNDPSVQSTTSQSGTGQRNNQEMTPTGTIPQGSSTMPAKPRIVAAVVGCPSWLTDIANILGFKDIITAIGEFTQGQLDAKQALQAGLIGGEVSAGGVLTDRAAGEETQLAARLAERGTSKVFGLPAGVMATFVQYGCAGATQVGGGLGEPPPGSTPPAWIQVAQYNNG